MKKEIFWAQTCTHLREKRKRN